MDTIESLEDALSQPSQAVRQTFCDISGDILILGAGGKMGPTLAMMARRALEELDAERRVIAVSRFSNGGALVERLERKGIEVVRGDLLDESCLRQLPEAPNIIYLAGMKFGATGNEPLTWAMNVYLPAKVARRFPASRIVALSTGNVYGLVPRASGGSREDDALRPAGEYANSCLGRERMFQYFSQSEGTPVALIRLNYANELRYGVLVDIAKNVLAGVRVDLSMPYVNVIWQGEANAMVLSALAQATAPATVLNVAGPEIVSVREVAMRAGEIAGVEPTFTGESASDSALLSNGSKAAALFGKPAVSVEQMLSWAVAWLRGEGETLGKPTHFENRKGDF